MSQLDTLCVELTLRCPLRCIHCSANAAPERRETLDADLLVARVREFGHLEALYLSGGEPFEHPKLPEIAESLSGLANEISIYSSGIVIGSNGLEPLAEAAIHRIGKFVSRVDISIYSVAPDEHDAVTGITGSLQLSLQAIRTLRLLAVPFGIHFVPVRGYGAMLEVAHFARDAGAKRFHVLAVARQGRAATLRPENSDEVLDALKLLARAELGTEIVLSSQLRKWLGLGGTDRDRFRAAFLDVHGHMYANEGARLPSHRKLRTLSDSPVTDLLSDIV